MLAADARLAWGLGHSAALKGSRSPARCPLTPLVSSCFQLSPHVLEEPVITKDMYEVAISLIQMFDDTDMKESG